MSSSATTDFFPNLQTSPPPEEAEDIVWPPCNLDSDEPPLETDLHREQIDLLIRLLKWLWREREDFYASGNLTVYYSPNQVKSRDFRGPDFFVVLNTEKRPRKSWTVWEEGGKYPNLIVELLSESTAITDRTLKKELYQDIFRTPDYFWFDPQSLEFEGFHLVDGKYQPLSPTEQGWLWSEQLGLYLGIHESQLRFFTPQGSLVASPEEAAVAAQKQLEATQRQVDLEYQRNQRLLAKLQELGFDPGPM